MSYRVEVSNNNRAMCQATHCKKEGIKILKGEIRQGVFVTIGENQSWKYRHWGCVTPLVIHNWKETSGMDMDLVDGYDTLPDEIKEKVKRALEQGHVDDEDWKGDLECNRYTGKKSQGMFVKTPKKKAKDDDDDEDDEEESPTKKKATKKRGRAKADDDEVDDEEPKPAAKKAKGRPKKAAKEIEEAEEAEPPKKAKGRPKKAKPAPTVDSDEAEAPAEEAEPALAKKSRAKRATAKAPDADNGDAEVKPQKRKGRGKKAAAEQD
ncbi:hypothetical protein LTR37_008797 [Vermiconidia calcicola]|uniref:Uncharacterized protein n=1 Tax=Vermiconidia calcicola TaxID=1690605 RepID=A0ACC3NAT1_9PEZI|nr:hypothetical protein LTR37_008797 [Vermiconidia calcicola]